MINFRENWRGYLWQGRFASFPMDESYLLKAAAYVELNPVKAKMVKQAKDYRWSSVHAHVEGHDPFGIVDAQKLLAICGDWKDYLKRAMNEPEDEFIRHSNTGRPLGDLGFIEKAENMLSRKLRKKTPGPKIIQNN